MIANCNVGRDNWQSIGRSDPTAILVASRSASCFKTSIRQNWPVAARPVVAVQEEDQDDRDQEHNPRDAEDVIDGGDECLLLGVHGNEHLRLDAGVAGRATDGVHGEMLELLHGAQVRRGGGSICWP